MLKLTQDQIAQKLGVSRPTIAGYESEEKNRVPRQETLNKIADIFGISIDWLMGITDNPIPNDDEREFNDFINDPNLGLWFKELKDSPEEQVDELRKIWEIIKQRESISDSKDKHK